MKIVARRTLYQLIDNGPEVRGHINGRPYNWTTEVRVVPVKDGFKWTLDTGNRIKNLRGPFPSIDAAFDAAKSELGMFDGSEPRG